MNRSVLKGAIALPFYLMKNGVFVLDVFEAIGKRVSIRQFKPDAVSGETVDRLIEAAGRAPSGGNWQSWYFYAVYNQEKRTALAKASNDFVSQAPVVIVACCVADRSEDAYGDRGRDLYCIQDSAAAIGYLLLACAELGLGACWVGDIDEEAVAEIVGADKFKRPVAVIPVGYPAEEQEPRWRLPLNEIRSEIL